MTYPICIACGAHILDDANHRNLDDGRATHYQCPEVEDLDALPLVERAAIVCSMRACNRVCWPDACELVGIGIRPLVCLALSSIDSPASVVVDPWSAEAECLIRTGEVTP